MTHEWVRIYFFTKNDVRRGSAQINKRKVAVAQHDEHMISALEEVRLTFRGLSDEPDEENDGILGDDDMDDEEESLDEDEGEGGDNYF